MDTIVALSTPAGRSAIAVIRVSGPESLRLARSLIADPDFSPEPSRAVLRKIKSSDQNEVLDKSLLTYFQAPNSYTGEDVVELSCHGSPVVLRQMIDLILGYGARLAGPGEFTMRGLANGKLNLSQAEAIRDLINAQTEAAAKQATRQLMGELSQRLKLSEDKLIKTIVQLESALEFVEDDLPAIRKQEIQQTLVKIIESLEELTATFAAGHLLRDGLRVTLAGRPNVGKSSLFNTLLAHERAIVTDIPGTTRDTITEAVSINGVPVLLTDTAGLRESTDDVERIGVDRTHQAMADADLIVVVLDGSVDLSNEDLNLLSHAQELKHVIARNKSDLPNFLPPPDSSVNNGVPSVDVSALTGSGVEALCAAILAPFGALDSANDGLLITSARHYDLLKRAVNEIRGSIDLLEQDASEELILIGLHNSLRFLGQITGETTTEDLLSEIFATFCIGK
jgi:tRNA modification GTPase